MNRAARYAIPGIAVALCMSASRLGAQPKFVWNASASAPIGLYRIVSVLTPAAGDLVAVRPPVAMRLFLAQRGYLPDGALLLKRIVASSGDVICRDGEHVLVAGTQIARAKQSDARGRPLPQWQGCRSLREQEVFLVNADVPDSLDGRYFGPLPGSSIVGLAHPVWTAGEDSGRN
jgi:conjugative transfer signal peptidase TraF